MLHRGPPVQRRLRCRSAATSARSPPTVGTPTRRSPGARRAWLRRPTGPESYGQQPPPPGYGPPPGSGFPPPAEYGQQPGYSPPWGGYGAAAPAPTSQQTISWVSLAAIGLMGLLGAILTLTLWINLNSAVSRAADVCNRFGGEYSSMCREQIKNMVPTVPVALVVCLFLIIAACLAVAAGAVMLFVKRPMGQFLILGGGIVMLMLVDRLRGSLRRHQSGHLRLDRGPGDRGDRRSHVRPGIPGGLGVAAEIDRCPSARRLSGRRAMAARSTAATAVRPAGATATLVSC